MWPNAFLNPYRQPENRLMHNFLCLLAQYHAPEFLEFLLGEPLGSKAVIEDFETVLGGDDDNPDALFVVRAGGKRLHVFLDVLTVRDTLDPACIKRHLANHCGENEHARLLVITPYGADRRAVQSLGGQVRFRPWPEIAGFLTAHTNDPIAASFVRYGEEQGEFFCMSISKQDMQRYAAYIQSSWELKFTQLLHEVVEIIQDEDDFPIRNAELVPQNAGGRHVVKVEFPPRAQSDYGQWLACGMYYDPIDSRIPFKEPGVPELAFFFDMDAAKVESLSDEIKDACKKLGKKGFEDNAEGQITPNRCRLLFRRQPLSQIEQLDADVLKAFLYDSIRELGRYPALAKLVSAKK